MASEIRSGYVDVDGLRTFQAVPDNEDPAPGGGMLLLPMITGIGEQVRLFAEQIARETGVVAVTWDPWHGPSSDDTEHAELSRLLSELDDHAVVEEQERLLAYMRSTLGVKHVGVIGWCLGGRFAFILGGRDPELANVIAYHPTVTIPPAKNHAIDAIEQIRHIAAPVMMAYPGKDSIVSRGSFDRMQEALLQREGAPSMVHLYPDAKHGFSDARRHVDAPNAQAFNLSWPQALALIRSTSVSS